MSVHIGSIVWVCRTTVGRDPASGPRPALVLGGSDALDLAVFNELGTPSFVPAVTPWSVEDGSEWGWLEIPVDGIIPANLLENA